MDKDDKQFDLEPNEWKAEDKRNQPFWGPGAAQWLTYAFFWIVGFLLWKYFTGKL